MSYNIILLLSSLKKLARNNIDILKIRSYYIWSDIFFTTLPIAHNNKFLLQSFYFTIISS